MIEKPQVSIIIATYNSEKTLPLVLKSISRQTFKKKDMEVILVDGGSIDKTKFIGKKFGCSIVNNLRTEPVYGKYLGYLKAKGKYVMYLDHDEVMLNRKSIASKVSALKNNPNTKAVAGGNYVSPKGYPIVNDYINDFGDPFSFFMYRLSKRYKYFLEAMKSRYLILSESKNNVLFDLTGISELPIIELVAGGSMFDASVLKKEFPETKKRFELLPHFFYFLYMKYPSVIVAKNDPLVHYSSDNMKKYLKKIQWRVKNNILFGSTMGVSGYLGREKFQPELLRFKKYLFIPYSFSLVLPLYDALNLSISRKNSSYFWHFPLCIFTASLIIYFYVLKTLKIKTPLRNYDDSKVVALK